MKRYILSYLFGVVVGAVLASLWIGWDSSRSSHTTGEPDPVGYAETEANR